VPSSTLGGPIASGQATAPGSVASPSSRITYTTAQSDGPNWGVIAGGMLAVVVLLYLGLSGRFSPTSKTAPVPSAPLVGENAAATGASPTITNAPVGDSAPGTLPL